MQPAPFLAPLLPGAAGAAPVPSLSSLQLPARAAELGTGGSSPPVTPRSLLGAPSPDNQCFPQPMPGLAPHHSQLLPACPGGVGGLRGLPVPASYPRGEGGFGISLPTALLSFPACLSAWIPTAPALTGPATRAGGCDVPRAGQAPLDTEHGVGTCQFVAWHCLVSFGTPWGLREGCPLRVPCPPRCTWLGSQGRGAGQPRNSGTHLTSIVPWEPVGAFPRPSGACPGRS